MLLFYRYFVLNLFVSLLLLLLFFFLFLHKKHKKLSLLSLSFLDLTHDFDQINGNENNTFNRINTSKMSTVPGCPHKVLYTHLVQLSCRVKINNETASVSLDSLLLQFLTTNGRNIDTYFFVGPKCKHYFSMCIKTNVTAYILTVWLNLMAKISAFETN